MAHQLCAELTDFASWVEFGILRKDWGYIADQAPSTHPVASNGSPDARSALADFDGISYAKGAAALRQLADFLGPEVFYRGLRGHFRRHRFANADFGDLIAAWQEAGAEEIDVWTSAWLRTSGLDTLNGSPADSNLVIVNRLRPDGATEQPRRPHAVRVRGYSPTGQPVVDSPVVLTGDRVAIPVAELPLLVVADGVDQTWAKIRFGSGDWSAVREVLPRIAEADARVVVYNAVRDAVRDGELPPVKAWLILQDALAAEDHDLVIASLFTFATKQLAGCYSPLAARAERRAGVARVAAFSLADAAAGSDRQLVTARALVAATSDVATLHAWLERRRVPDGLRIDPELRWLMVERLATLGEMDERGVAGELAADRSAAGVVHAARACALIPDVEAKKRAWHLLSQPSSLPAYELYATAEGFFEPSQTELTADYATRFFVDLPATAAFRRGYALAQIALLAYPMSHPDAHLVTLADSTLASDGIDPGVRRSLVDGTDALRRALSSIARHG
jgi:aminopeptidase N